ncbi:MAG: acetolactate synthase large subunit [Deltaproteobacteria bacterium]|nr:acetolactate synthase large subunit [Deltaproteobacteria bacterium]
MNGAEILLKTAAAAGVDVCFSNPGTTEMPIVAAFDNIKSVKPVLCLFEGVCTGAADGFGRIKGLPALTLLHLGPGFANGIANLHNARRAGTPVVNIVGDHPTWHLAADAPLTMDIASLAKPVSLWQRYNESVETLPADLVEAIKASLYGGVSTLIVPNDCQWLEYTAGATARVDFSFDPVDAKRIDDAAKALNDAKKPLLLIGGAVLREAGLKTAARIQAMTGCEFMMTGFPGHMDRGNGLPSPRRVPYFPEEAVKMLAPYDVVILAGMDAPVAFFGYRDGQSKILGEDTTAIRIDGEKQNALDAVAALADSISKVSNKADAAYTPGNDPKPELPMGRLSRGVACRTIAALQPENAIIVDEGLTSSGAYLLMDSGLSPHTYLTNMGGSIGWGMPCATGAAIAAPNRPVINFQADGSGMYTAQALWTQARENLDITTLVCKNNRYSILQAEYLRAGNKTSGSLVASLIELDRPTIDWVNISWGMGVPAVSVDTCEDLAKEFKKALGEEGPHLIEMNLG